MIQIVLADDHKLFRDGLRKILELEPEVKVVGEASNGEEALQLLREHNPDIVLFDINMPKMDGVQLAREINSLKLKVVPIAVSAYDDEDCLATLSAEGVMGFVLKSSGRVELIAAIRAAYRREPYVDPRVAGKLMTSFAKRKSESDLLAELSPREKVVLYWLAQGYSNLEVAEKTVLSEKTVKNHVSHMLKKLELRDRTQAAVMAWKVGFAQMSPETMEQVSGGGNNPEA
ncbi:MAG: response regulator transcription factor [Fretibacterium sp.]|uniref:response regulator n=1 Tax=Fretibacterium sp. OH1220_COT-178 TaxID=2491047 RepID=UPI001315A7A4|nr:response regulator transcription factor [Fretibacterium sp. OH1220_COT-178]MDO4785437.1 response regulator transcription factor [Fretibacterium sp.]